MWSHYQEVGPRTVNFDPKLRACRQPYSITSSFHYEMTKHSLKNVGEEEGMKALNVIRLTYQQLFHDVLRDMQSFSSSY